MYIYSFSESINNIYLFIDDILLRIRNHLIIVNPRNKLNCKLIAINK